MKSKPAPLNSIQSSGKKQDPLKIVLSTCRVAYCKDIKKKFKVSQNLIERCTKKKKMKNKKYRYVRVNLHPVIQANA